MAFLEQGGVVFDVDIFKLWRRDDFRLLSNRAHQLLALHILNPLLSLSLQEDLMT